MSTTADVAKAHEALEKDHERVRQLVARLREAADLPTLVAVLDELNSVLVPHFAHEEQPGGLYDVLGMCSPDYRAPLGNLVDDHYRLLSVLRDLGQRARELLEHPHEDLMQEARRLADQIADHERRENELAETARRAGQ